MIYPLSKFGVSWLFVTGLFLAYTGVVTAPLVAFYWLEAECSIVPTLFFDTAVDCFFILDIFLNFKTGIFDGAEYIDAPAVVARKYLRGSFLFDCVTSFPVSFFELVAKTDCDAGKTATESGAIPRERERVCERVSVSV